MSFEGFGKGYLQWRKEPQGKKHISASECCPLWDAWSDGSHCMRLHTADQRDRPTPRGGRQSGKMGKPCSGGHC